MIAFADDKINVPEKLEFVLGWVENIVGNGENAAYQHCYGRPLFQAWLLPDLNTIPNNCVGKNSLWLSGYCIGFSTRRPCPNLIFLPCIYSFLSLLQTLFVRAFSPFFTKVFRRLLSQGRKKSGFCGKELREHHHICHSLICILTHAAKECRTFWPVRFGHRLFSQLKA